MSGSGGVLFTITQVFLTFSIPIVIVWGYLGLVQYLDNRGRISKKSEFYWVIGFVVLFYIYTWFIFPAVRPEFLVFGS